MISELFTTKSPIFVLSSTRAKHEFYRHFALNKEFYARLDSLDIKVSEGRQDFENLDSNLEHKNTKNRYGQEKDCKSWSTHLESHDSQNINTESENKNSVSQDYFRIFDFSINNVNNSNNVTNSINFDDFNTFLPMAFSVAEFFAKIVVTKKPIMSKLARDFFLANALKKVKSSVKRKSTNPPHSLLNFDDNFIDYLEISGILLDFYNELRNHKIPINARSLQRFCEIDSYDFYSKELEILGKIYHIYTQDLRNQNLVDNFYSNEIYENYEINAHFLESFSSIHIELEGFMPPLQHEVLQKVSQIIPVFLHFKTDMYNISHFNVLYRSFISKNLTSEAQSLFQSVANKHELEKDSKNLESKMKDSNFYAINPATHIAKDSQIPVRATYLKNSHTPHLHTPHIMIKRNTQNIYHVYNNNCQLFSQKIKGVNIDNIKLYKTQKSFNQANLAIYLAHTWLEKIEKNMASENDFAIILPDESFALNLATLDSHNVFNYAMGQSVKSLEPFGVLETMYKDILASKVNVECLREFLGGGDMHYDEGVDLRSLDSKSAFEIVESLDDKLASLSNLSNQMGHESYLKGLDFLQELLLVLFQEHKGLLAKGIEILSELTFLHKRDLIRGKDFKEDFDNIFTAFMREFSALSVDNVSGGKIKVIGTLEARNLGFKEVLILDFTDDLVPNVTFDDMFINSKIRSFYDMPTKIDKENLYKHHYYNIIRNTHLSHICYVENDEKIPSSMLFELHCDVQDSIDIDKVFSFYDESAGVVLDTTGAAMEAKAQDFKYFNNHTESPLQKSTFIESAKSIEFSPPFPSFNHISFRFSATALNIYKDCVRKFYFRYVENLREQRVLDSKANIGSIIHRFLYESYLPFTNKILEMKDIAHIKHTFDGLHSRYVSDFVGEIKSGKSDDVDLIIALDNICANASLFFTQERDRVEKNEVMILGLEQKFDANIHALPTAPSIAPPMTSPIKTRGIIDRIDKENDKIVIIDYKTSKNAPSKDDLQMPFYDMCMGTFLSNFKELEDLDRIYKYVMLGEFKTKEVLRQDMQECEGKIRDIFRTFGMQNNMCEDVKLCYTCEYNVLCGRE